jgi:hypothetical protein
LQKYHLGFACGAFFNTKGTKVLSVWLVIEALRKQRTQKIRRWRTMIAVLTTMAQVF